VFYYLNKKAGIHRKREHSMKQPGPQESAYSMHPGMEMGIVSLTVADLERSLSFYERILGCTLLASSGDTAVLGSERPLLILTERQDALPRPVHSTGLYHVAFLLPGRTDLACALRHLLESGYPPSSLQDHGISEAIYLSDPEGNGIELYRDRPRAAWPWQNDTLEATEPSVELHIDSLLAELDGIEYTWRGLPPFTRIGHVHLQVADLEQSAAFYQRVLGLEESITGMSGACFFATGGYHHHIGCNVWTSSGASAPPRGARGLNFFTLMLPERAEVVQLAARAHAAGIPMVQHEQSCLLRDPAGNGVLLTAESLQQSEEVMALTSAFH
jgi:catechol 2,3-dioxygenase